jgi:hypothetical protein
MNIQILVNALLLGIILVFGIYLHRMGRPYHPLWFNLHKLAALGLVVYATLMVIPLARAQGLEGLFLGLVILAVVSAIVLFVSGGLMSADKMHKAMVQVHRVANYAFIAGLAGIFYFLWGK